MSNLLLLNKPYLVLSQFSPKENKDTLAKYGIPKGFYPAGRLDYDSEGLLLLTNDGKLQNQIADPKHKMEKSYWVQVEGEINAAALKTLKAGLDLKDGKTKPAKAKKIEEPDIWRREPPIRKRKSVPTSWIELKIKEGKNRQVRRMTAAVGYPTLRLIRFSIGSWGLDDLAPGEFRETNINLPKT